MENRFFPRLLIGSALLVAWLPLSCTSGTFPAETGRSLDAAIVDRWEIDEVRSLVGAPTFVPQHTTGLTLDRHGNAGWSDGCNGVGGSYHARDGEFRIEDWSTTEIACPFEPDSMDYRAVTGYELRGKQLLLFTGTQVYVLHRFPYSVMSRTPGDWSESSNPGVNACSKSGGSPRASTRSAWT
jgi:hypothetical protein